MDSQVGNTLIIRADLFYSGINVAAQVAVVEPSGYTSVGQGAQRALTGQAEVFQLWHTLRNPRTHVA